MAIETLKENLCVNQIIGKAKENIIAEGDVIIPDIKPDILSTINTNGTVCIYKKEILDGLCANDIKDLLKFYEDAGWHKPLK